MKTVILENSDAALGSLISEHLSECAGEILCPGQRISPEDILNYAGEQALWKSCLTTNNHWPYCREDNSFKSSASIVQKLVECVSKGGNLLLNIGRDPKGRIPGSAVELLTEVGNCMENNSKSIYGCGTANLTISEYGRITRHDRA